MPGCAYVHDQAWGHKHCQEGLDWGQGAGGSKSELLWGGAGDGGMGQLALSQGLTLEHGCLNILGPRPPRESPEPASPLCTAQALGPEAGWQEEGTCTQPAPHAPEQPHQGDKAWLCSPPFPTLETEAVLGNLVLP